MTKAVNHTLRRTWLPLLLFGALLAGCGTTPTPANTPTPPSPTTPTVTGVTIDQGDLDLLQGDTTRLTATVEAGDGASTVVTWTSDTPGVVAIDSASGAVTASGSAGDTAQVTATSSADASISDTVTVTVTVAATTDPTLAPEITAFSSAIVRGSQVELSWSADRGDSFDVLALLEGGGTETVESGLTGSTITLAIPASDRQTLRLVATNAAGEASEDLTLSNVVTSSADYDPYRLRGYSAETQIPGTLRAVIANAISGSVVGFASDIDTLIVDGVDIEEVPDLTAADAHLIFRDDVTVSGPSSGVTIEGASNCPDCVSEAEHFVWRSRLILVHPDASVTLENLTLTGGTFIYAGAGISNYGTLTLDTVEVSGNRSLGRGGGIHNKSSGVLTIVDSAIVNNRSVTLESELDATFYIRNVNPGGEVDFPGANGSGGGIFNDLGGVVTIQNSVVERNEARVSGGGIYNLGDITADLTNVADNVADHDAYDAVTSTYFSYGGGIYNDGDLALGSADILGNVAASQGGGLYHGLDGVSSVANALIQGNVAGTAAGETGYGGGVLQRHYSGEQANLSLPTAPYGTGNEPGNYLAVDSGTRPATLRTAPSSLQSTMPSGDDPDDRNR